MMRALRACSSVGGLPPTRSGRPRALVETDRGRTTTSERTVAVAPQRGWRLAVAGIVAVGAVLGSAAWIWSLRAASQSADRSTNETLVAAEHALAAAAAALDRANQNSREHEPAAPICEAATPVESAAEKEPRGEPEAPPSATTTTVNQPAVTPANQPLPAPTEADEAKDSHPTVVVPPAVVPQAAVPPLDKSLEASPESSCHGDRNFRGQLADNCSRHSTNRSGHTGNRIDHKGNRPLARSVTRKANASLQPRRHHRTSAEPLRFLSQRSLLGGTRRLSTSTPGVRPAAGIRTERCRSAPATGPPVADPGRTLRGSRDAAGIGEDRGQSGHAVRAVAGGTG